MAALRQWRLKVPYSSFECTRPLSKALTGRAISWWGFKKPKIETDPAKLAAKVDPGLRLGDYPVLPWRSAQEEHPSGWWDDQDRRDKETPIHEEDDGLNMWMYDAIENNGKYTRWEALGQLMVMFSLLGGLYYLSVLYDAPSRNPAVPRQFPYDNLYIERGGDPNQPTDSKNNKVYSTYGEFVS